MRLADLLLGNDLLQANSKLKDPIEVVNFHVSPSPVMDKATSSESIGNQMSEIVVPSSDQIVESGVTLVDSYIVVPSSDPIEIAAVTRSQSKHKSEVGDGDTGPVTQSDETNRILRDMNMTKLKEMKESDSSLHALWMKAMQNDSRYCLSNDLLDERSSVVDDPGLLVLPDNLRDVDMRERLKKCSKRANEHGSTLQVEMETHYVKNSRQRSQAAGHQRVLVLLPDSNNSLLCNWKGQHTKVNDTNYEIDLGHRVACLHINLFIETIERKNR